MTNRNLISCFVNSQYETLSNWLSSTLYDEHFLPLLKERYITYYVQNFLIPSIFDFTLKNTANPGGIVEIGCAEGYLSEILSSTAKNNKVDYVAIDPWNGQQEGDESKYQSFLKKIEKIKIQRSFIDSLLKTERRLIFLINIKLQLLTSMGCIIRKLPMKIF